MPSSASTSLERFERGYLWGLLQSPHKSLRTLVQEGYLPHRTTQSTLHLAADPLAHQKGWEQRLQAAPTNGYLVVDLLSVPHSGGTVEGVDRIYSSSEKRVVWGHSWVASSLVYPQRDIYPLRLEPFPTLRMSGSLYPHLTPGEGLLNIVGDVKMAGYPLKGVVADAQMFNRIAMRSLHGMDVPFLARIRSNSKVWFEQTYLCIRDLAERYRPGKARYYPRFGWYAKKLAVFLPEVGPLYLLLVWKPQGYGFGLMALVTTLDQGVQSLLSIWKLRWQEEVAHRIYKQNLGLSRCQCRKFASQVKHADLVLQAFHLVRAERARANAPPLDWRMAQRKAALKLKYRLLTEQSPLWA